MDILLPRQQRPPCTADEVATYVVGAAVWAPSVHNTQPWLFTAAGTELTLYADVTRQLPVADPGGREMMISCGAALFTAKLALRSLGYVPETRVLPDPDDPLLIAKFRWRRREYPAVAEERLFDQVTRRRTHRGGFQPVPPDPGLIEALRQDAAWHGAALRVACTDEARAVLAAITDMAEQVEHLDTAYVRELAAWAPPPKSTRLDGVSASSYPARKEVMSPYFAARDFAGGRGWGLQSPSPVSPARFAGLVCLLTTPADTPVAWVNAGQALQRILLRSATSGVAAALHSQPVEVDWLREAIRAQLGDGSYPQLLLRFGTVVQNAVSQRRPPESVLRRSPITPAAAPPVADLRPAGLGSPTPA
jgi:nitroreductase